MHGAEWRSSESSGNGLDAELGQVLAEGRALIRAIGKGPLSERVLYQLMDHNDRLAALHTAWERNTAQGFMADELVELGRQLERKEGPGRPFPPGKRRAGQRHLMSVAPR